MSLYAPADSLAFIEGNDLPEIINGIDQSAAWQALAQPMGAPPRLAPNHWWIALARWTGIGSADALVLARAQAAVLFSGAEGSQSGSTLTIKPLAVFVLETHTSQWRMKSVIEHHLEDLARRVYQNPVFMRKTVGGFEFQEWAAGDGSHQIIFAFLDTALIVGNDETSVLHSIEARLGTIQALRNVREFRDARERTDSTSSSVFGFVSQGGIKSLLQAYAIYRGDSSSDAVTAARIFSDTFGGIIKTAGWSARFRDGMIEDRCSFELAEGVAEKLRTSVRPDRGPDITHLAFVPTDAHSVSLYQLHDAAGFWSDLNAAVSSHTDLIGSIAARPMLKSILKSYGIDDPDAFARAIGTRIQTIRVEENSPSVLIAEAFDRPALRTLANRRLGKNPKSETVGEAELILSATDNWAAAFVDNYFLIGPAEAVRRCLITQSQKQSLSSTEPFRKSQDHIDVSLPMISLTFTRDQRPAISFIESFSRQQRSAFATNGNLIDQAANALPMAVSATVLRDSDVEWTARSSFGIGGFLTSQLFPESYK